MRHLRHTVVVLILLGILAACGGGSDDEPTPAPSPQATATEVAQAPTEVPPTVVGNTASDGVCTITIPVDWTDDGTGRGTTAEGDRWSIGNRLASDAAWTTAKERVVQQFEGAAGGVDQQDDGDRITIRALNNRSYVTRIRFDGYYCEFLVTARADRTDEIVAIWRGTAATLRRE